VVMALDRRPAFELKKGHIRFLGQKPFPRRKSVVPVGSG
jgi:hypothetical protein